MVAEVLAVLAPQPGEFVVDCTLGYGGHARELLARVAAVMRRIRPALAGESIEVGDILLDPVAHKVTRRGRTLQLGPTEYRLLVWLMRHPRARMPLR